MFVCALSPLVSPGVQIHPSPVCAIIPVYVQWEPYSRASYMFDQGSSRPTPTHLFGPYYETHEYFTSRVTSPNESQARALQWIVKSISSQTWACSLWAFTLLLGMLMNMLMLYVHIGIEGTVQKTVLIPSFAFNDTRQMLKILIYWSWFELLTN